MPRDRYIGITGFTEREQVEKVLDAMPGYTNRKLMVGILASRATLRRTQNPWHPNRYPTLDKLATIPVDDPRTYTLIHYYTQQTATLFDQLAELTERCGTLLNGFQLNIPWPDPDTLRAYRAHYPSKQFVLPITDEMIKEANGNMRTIADRLNSEYDGLAEHILLDGSLGEEKMFAPRIMRERIAALKAASIKMGIGVAGGISPHTTDLVRYVAEEHRDINTDAEGGVHSKEEDLFDVTNAVLLVQKQAKIFRHA